MTTLVFILPSDDIASGLKTSLDIYTASGMSPKIISDGRTTVTFDSKDASLVVHHSGPIIKYIDKHQID